MDPSQFTLHAEIEDRHWWFRVRREIIRRVLELHGHAGDGVHLLEIGCGTGGNLKYLGRFFRVSGVDISPVAVAFARERLSSPVLQGDFRELYPDGFTDVGLVLLADVLEHIEDDRAFLAGVVERLPPGGSVLITVPAHRFLWSGHDEVLGHVRRYSPSGLRDSWGGLPVTEVYFSYFNTLLFPAIALLRLLARSREAKSDLKLPSPAVNRLLYRIFSLEKYAVGKVPLPAGVSLLALLRKNGTVERGRGAT